MTERPDHILLCSCEDTMQFDTEAIRCGCRGAELKTARQLCRAELARFRAALAESDTLIVGCTQEAPGFTEVAEDTEGGARMTFVNLRETAGWSDQAGATGPKMAALLAAAGVPSPELEYLKLKSEGDIVIYGRGAEAFEAAGLLGEGFRVSILLNEPSGITPPRVNAYSLAKGGVCSASGYLGAFELVVDDFALATPSSRAELAFVAPRNGIKLKCDIFFDISGKAPLFPGHNLRDGYVRADPGNSMDVMRAVLKARDLVGTFDKPRYIAFTEELCAHSRSGIIGCRRCLDLCPAGAIMPNGDHVGIDANICGGCGECAAACPTGAAAYVLPPGDTLLRKVRALLLTYREAAGVNPILLFHDDVHGADLIDALARYGAGLPANVLPLAVNEVTQIGLEAVAAAFSYGASDIRLLMSAKPRHDRAGLRQTVELAEPILRKLGYGSIATIETDDPDVLATALAETRPCPPTSQPSSFMPAGRKRELLQFALGELHGAAPTQVNVIDLPRGAPFGAVEVDAAGCTLCLACVTACPTGALRDDVERPALRFAEEACVQCGLCKATCPEKVISLMPRIDFAAMTAPPRVLKQEEPFFCIRCGKPFGVKSTIERVSGKLAEQHWMYRGSAKRLDLIKMCDTCRVAAATQDAFDPHGAPPRPQVRTTDDYLHPQEDDASAKRE